MSTASSFGDKIFKAVTSVLAATTVISLGTLGINVYFNTGSRRKTLSPIEASEDVPQSDSLLQPIETPPTDRAK